MDLVSFAKNIVVSQVPACSNLDRRGPRPGFVSFREQSEVAIFLGWNEAVLYEDAFTGPQDHCYDRTLRQTQHADGADSCGHDGSYGPCVGFRIVGTRAVFMVLSHRGLDCAFDSRSYACRVFWCVAFATAGMRRRFQSDQYRIPQRCNISDIEVTCGSDLPESNGRCGWIGPSGFAQREGERREQKIASVRFSWRAVPFG